MKRRGSYTTGVVQGSMIFEPTLLFSMLDNYCKEIARNGFDKIVFLNFHGGNINMLAQFQRMLAYEKTDYYVSVISPFKVYETTFKAMYENLKKNRRSWWTYGNLLDACDKA